MSNETFVTVRGNAARDPERREGSKMPWVRFSIGVTAQIRNAEGGYEDRPTQWFEVRVFGAQAGHVAESVRKGTPVLVRGELRHDQWENKDGERFSRNVVLAESVALDLHYRSYSLIQTRPELDAPVEQSSTPRAAADSDPLGVGETPGGPWSARSSAQIGEYSVPVA